MKNLHVLKTFVFVFLMTGFYAWSQNNPAPANESKKIAKERKPENNSAIAKLNIFTIVAILIDGFVCPQCTGRSSAQNDGFVCPQCTRKNPVSSVSKSAGGRKQDNFP